MHVSAVVTFRDCYKVLDAQVQGGGRPRVSKHYEGEHPLTEKGLAEAEHEARELFGAVYHGRLIESEVDETLKNLSAPPKTEPRIRLRPIPVRGVRS